MKVRFFKNPAQFRQWLEKNHSREREIAVGFYKNKTPAMKYKEAVDQALCFGWINGVIKGIDSFTYLVRFMRRKPRSTWSNPTIKRFKELKRLGFVRKPGVKTFEN